MKYTFDQFKFICESFADKFINEHPDMPCICKVNDYSKYNWYNACFMTDDFGGIATIIKIVNNDVITINDEVVENLDNAYDVISKDIIELCKNRNFNELYDFINSQY